MCVCVYKQNLLAAEINQTNVTMTHYINISPQRLYSVERI